MMILIYLLLRSLLLGTTLHGSRAFVSGADTEGLFQPQYKFEDLPPCSLSTLEIFNLASSDNIEPCILYDIGPTNYNETTNKTKNDTTTAAATAAALVNNGTDDYDAYDLIVTNLMVTSSNCRDHRDGAVVGVDKLNGDNDGRGFAIGFNKDFYVGFRLISIIAGNPSSLGNEAYMVRHEQLLRTALEATTGEFRYIIGTCSSYAAIEKELAMKHETILISQVGPQAFYNSVANPWVFGFHVNSDDYAAASIRKLQFMAKSQPGGLTGQAVRVIYRTESEFFHNTCASAIRLLMELGFTDVKSVLYDPFGDDDGNDIENSQDSQTMIDVADQVCAPGSATDSSFRPALFLCTLTEHELILPRLRENGCLLSFLWMTPATWAWALDNQDQVAYVQGAGQWHSGLQYSDDYFDSGVDMLEYNQIRVGYVGGYDMLVSYAIPVFFAAYLHSIYRVYDTPTPMEDVATMAGRETMRRLMLNVRADTIFGTVQFDDNQRNNGREAAASQWQPRAFNMLENALFSPDNQAQAELIIPAATASNCPGGEFVNVSLLQNRAALLESVCSLCPPESYSTSPGQELECLACPEGTTTNGMNGSINCTTYDDNLLSKGMLSFGYVALAISWSMALVFMAWVIVYRRDPVVRLAQIPFLLLICVGGMISSSAIVGLTFQADHEEDTDQSSAGCMAAPILYSIGWIIQYGSLCSKTLRLSMVVESSSAGRRVKFGVWSSSYAIAIPLVLDIAILTAWCVINPLVYKREETGRSYSNGVVTIESIGRCRSSDDTMSLWVFLGPLLANHVLLVFITHWLLCKVRNVSSRYQENKHLSMAALFALEVAIVGGPILIAAQDSVEATFVVITGIVALYNIGVLAFIFIPKVFYQLKGLEEGVTVGESMLSATHKKAIFRESSRRAGSLFSSPSSFRQESSTHFWDEEKRSKELPLPSIAEASFEDDASESGGVVGGNENLTGSSKACCSLDCVLPTSTENTEDLTRLVSTTGCSFDKEGEEEEEEEDTKKKQQQQQQLLNDVRETTDTMLLCREPGSDGSSSDTECNPDENNITHSYVEV